MLFRCLGDILAQCGGVRQTWVGWTLTKENDLDPYRYLTWLMREATKLDMSDAQQAARLMPVNAPVECRAKKAFDANSTGYVIRFWIISK